MRGFPETLAIFLAVGLVAGLSVELQGHFMLGHVRTVPFQCQGHRILKVGCERSDRGDHIECVYHCGEYDFDMDQDQAAP